MIREERCNCEIVNMRMEESPVSKITLRLFCRALYPLLSFEEHIYSKLKHPLAIKGDRFCVPRLRSFITPRFDSFPSLRLRDQGDAKSLSIRSRHLAPKSTLALSG